MIRMFRINRLLIVGIVVSVISFVVSGCSLISSGTPPTATSAAVGQQPTQAFGAVVNPNNTLPPTFTQGPLLTPSPMPTLNGPTQPFGSVVVPNTTQHVTPLPTGLSATGLPPNVGPTVTFGAVVGPNFIPLPTETPAPVTPTLATLAPSFTPSISPTPGPVLRADLMGIQTYTFLTNDQWDQVLSRKNELGIGWTKLQVQWKSMEPAKGQFSQEYRTLVLDVQKASSTTAHTLLSIAKAPDWARPASARGIADDGPPDNPQDLADFITQLIKDCSAGNIDAIEIWNEPNLIREWHGKPLDGKVYMSYFAAAYQAIVTEEQAEPNHFRPNHRITVLTAGLAPTVTTQNTTNDRDWLQQMYDAGLAKYGNDVAIGVHPYGWANPPDSVCCTAQPGVTGWFEHPSFYFRNTIDEYHAIMLKNNAAKAKIWVTEFGWATYDGLHKSDGTPGTVGADSGWQLLINQGQQANYVLEAFYLAQKPPYSDFIGPMILWNLNFATVPKFIDQQHEEAGFSLLDGDGKPRPVYYAILNAAKIPPQAAP